jgi:hypothetical protein
MSGRPEESVAAIIHAQRLGCMTTRLAGRNRDVCTRLIASAIRP